MGREMHKAIKLQTHKYTLNEVDILCTKDDLGTLMLNNTVSCNNVDL